MPVGQPVLTVPDAVVVETGAAVVAAGTTQADDLHTAPAGQTLPHPPHASWSEVVS